MGESEEEMMEWLREIDRHYGFGHFQSHIGPPYKKINEDLIIYLHNEGWSNRAISREIGVARRTIDRRIIKLKSEGRL